MKKIERISEGKNYSAATVGHLNDLSEHVFVLAPGIEIPGKVFVGNQLKTTGAEMSFQMLPPNTGISFLHTHKTHEELYIIVKGHGEFQVDGDIFPVEEGAIVRVSPQGKRALRNTSDNPMTMICIQYKANSFAETDALDADILEEKVVW